MSIASGRKFRVGLWWGIAVAAAAIVCSRQTASARAISLFQFGGADAKPPFLATRSETAARIILTTVHTTGLAPQGAAGSSRRQAMTGTENIADDDAVGESEARKQLIRLAEQGDATAQYVLAGAYLAGAGGP